jgi:hypothetical protein
MHARVAWLPRKLRAPLLRTLLWLSVGDFERYGLEKPDHAFMGSHPVVNSELLYFIRHGRIHPRRDVLRFEGCTVRFTDGRSEDYDTVIACTGFKVSFPFLPQGLLDLSGAEVPLFLRCFPLDVPRLYFVGLLQPVGCIWPLAELQGALVAHHIAGRYRLPEDARARVRDLNEWTARTFMKTPRHSLEVDFEPFRRALLREIPKDVPPWPKAAPAS